MVQLMNLIDNEPPSARPNKTRDFLFQDPGDFLFIGPDREFVDIDSVEKCISIAKVIKGIGQTNYRQARLSPQEPTSIPQIRRSFVHWVSR